ncbi:sphingosine 1-phosphate receptor 1-like [Scleropages formosus]|nr:sphingosine 1-phosphate receptor 1-like [Scleropages formosus]
MNESDLVRKHYNFTGRLKDVVNWSGISTSDVLFIAVCCFIILENAMVLLTIWRTKKFHKPMFYFIGNLAFLDLLSGISYITNILLSGSYTFKLTPTEWFVREGSVFVALTASVISLLAIAVERYLTMIKMQLQSSGKTWRAFLIIGICWVIAAFFGSMPIMGWNCIDRMSSCSTVLPLYHKTYILFCISLFTLILMTIVALYIRIYVIVQSHGRNLAVNKAPNDHSDKLSEKSHALLRTVIIVLSCFITCWTPLFIIFAVDVVCDTGKCQILYELKWFLALAVLNSAMNPLIYMFTSKQIRSAFLRLLPCASWTWPNGKSMIANELISKSDSSQCQKDKPDGNES